jgi:hypothetical protein
MNLRKIHTGIVSGRFPLVAVILLFIFIRFRDSDEKTSPELWGLIALQIGIAFSLLYLNQTFIPVRKRTFLPVFFYLLFSIAHPLFYCSGLDGIAVFCIFLFLIFLFNPIQQLYPQGNALNIALVLTLGSFVWQALLFFFPVLWLGLFLFRCLNFRSFFASLVGFAMIYLFVFTVSIFWENSPEIFIERLPDFQSLFHFQVLSGFNLQEYIILIYLFIIFIIIGIHTFMSDISENARSMTILTFLYILTLIIFLFLFIQVQWKSEWASALCMPLAILVSRLFSSSAKKANIVLMLISIAFFVGMSVYR